MKPCVPLSRALLKVSLLCCVIKTVSADVTHPEQAKQSATETAALVAPPEPCTDLIKSGFLGAVSASNWRVNFFVGLDVGGSTFEAISSP
jgi:hypothetical protein